MLRMVLAGVSVPCGNRSRRRPQIRLLAAVTVVMAVLLAAGPGSAEDGDAGIRQAIKARCDRLVETGSLEVRGADIAANAAVPAFYQERGFAAAWTDPDRVQSLMRAVAGMESDGLDPEDYHHAVLGRINEEVGRSGAPDVELVADREMLLTDSLLRMAYHAEFGKVDPEKIDPNWNIYKELRSERMLAAIEEALESGDIEEYVEQAKPQHQLYTCLRNTLKRYRDIKAAGGWEPIPDNVVLRKGMTHDHVVALRRRLAATGDLPAGASTMSAEFDEELETGFIHFQERHGLAPDGIVGRASFDALNMTVDDRIRLLRVNLERGRWVLQDFADTFILVNIAGFRVYYVADNRIEWTARAQVGKTYRQTPVFKADVKYLVFNPTWTVPPTILAEDVLPAIQKDMGYLSEKNMAVLDRSGKVIDPGSIDWNRYSGSDFPYTVRQEPGPTNALGRVKFIFPNKHFVFLHDTPSKSLFDRAERAFSSGCIRVQNPFELAEILLADKGYDRARIAGVLESGELENVYLSEPVPVLLLYWTAFTTLDGRCNFRKDVYQRDPRIAEALDGPIMVRKEHEADVERRSRKLQENR